MRKFLTISIVIIAVIGLIFANNYSRGDPEKTYEMLWKSESSLIVSSKEQKKMEMKIAEALNEEYEVKDFFLQVRNTKGVQMSVILLTCSNQIKTFDFISEYPGPMYSLMVSGTPTFWFGDETEKFIDSCNFIIKVNKIVMNSKNEL